MVRQWHRSPSRTPPTIPAHIPLYPSQFDTSFSMMVESLLRSILPKLAKEKDWAKKLDGLLALTYNLAEFDAWSEPRTRPPEPEPEPTARSAPSAAAASLVPERASERTRRGSVRLRAELPQAGADPAR